MKPFTLILFCNAIIPVFNFCLPDKLDECFKQAKKENNEENISIEIGVKSAKQEDQVSDIDDDYYPDFYSDQDTDYNDDVSLESKSISRYGYPCKPR